MFKNKKWNKNRKKERKKYLICELLFIGTVIDVFFYDVTVAGNGQVNKLFHRCGYFGWPFIIFYLSFEGGGMNIFSTGQNCISFDFTFSLLLLLLLLLLLGRKGAEEWVGGGRGGRGSWVISLAVIGSAGFSGSICSESCSTWNWCFGHFWGSLMASSNGGGVDCRLDSIGLELMELDWTISTSDWIDMWIHWLGFSQIDLDWLGLAWIGLAWIGLAWLGLASMRLAWIIYTLD